MIKKLSFAAVLFTFNLVCPPLDAAADDWPRWRGAHFDGTGAPNGSLPENFTLESRWSRELGSGYSAVVVADGHAVTLFSDGRQDFVGALDALTGEDRWRVALAPTFAGREGAVDGPCSTPSIADGVVYALGPRGDLVAVELHSGRELWRSNVVESIGAPVPHWGFTSSPLVDGETLIVATGGGDGRVLTAYDRTTGRELWSAGQDEAGVNYSSPILATLAGRRQLIIGSDSMLTSVDPSSGELLWSHPHDGQSFYARIMNPVVTDVDRLFVNHRPTESTLLRFDDAEADSPFSVEWTSPHLNRNYATPLFRDGTIFGYAGSVLNAIDAATGESLWKSRKPGNGWPILVGDHLAVLTKEGELVLSEANRSGFDPVASTKMFQKLVWTPPSFADGAIFGRDSFGGIAAVDIVATKQRPDLVDRSTPPAKIAGSRFGRWVEKIRSAEDRVQEVERFLEQQPTSPWIEAGVAHIFYVGEAEELAVRSDMLLAREERTMVAIPLTKDGSGETFFYTSFELADSARVNYQFVRNFTETIADPRNPLKSQSFNMFSEVSLIMMPGAQPFAEVEPDPQARVESFEIEVETVQVGGQSWGGPREIRVYLPPGYDEGERRYPTVYLHYGVSFVELTDIEAQLGERIVVFVRARSAYEYARSQRGVHGRMIATQLVPEIDRRYRTETTAASRTIAGADEGGYSALEIGLRYPHLFGNVISQSLSAIGQGGRQIIDLIEMFPGLPLRVYLEWGVYDPIDPRNGMNGAEFNRRLRDTLVTNGYEVTAREWADGLDLGVLADRFRIALKDFYPPPE